jgi:arylsulfatase A-like enzyme
MGSGLAGRNGAIQVRRGVGFHLLLLLWLVSTLGCGRERPNLVLIVLDTVRADRLSSYGYQRPTTPRIDALAARGIRFSRASSTSGWTVPAHASLFTGLYPAHHGAHQEHPRLDRLVPTLAEILATEGYLSLGVSANPLVSRLTGLERGFDVFVDAWRASPAGDDSHTVLEAVRGALDSVPAGRPFFLFVNFMEAHSPYLPPASTRDRFVDREVGDALVSRALARTPAEFYVNPGSVSADELAVLSDLYDAELAALDGWVGALVDQLEAQGRLENTVLVLTSDHGEAFGEHGHLRHLFQLYATLVRVPLIVILPGGSRAGEVRHEPVSLVDLLPTLLARAGVESFPGSDGLDLLGDRGALASRPIFAEYYYPVQALANMPEGVVERHAEVFRPFRRRLRSVELGGLRLIASSEGDVRVFDVLRDPGELRNLAPDETDGARELIELLRDFAAAAPPAPLPDTTSAPDGSFQGTDAETRERLRELGYLAP